LPTAVENDIWVCSGPWLTGTPKMFEAEEEAVEEEREEAEMVEEAEEEEEEEE